MAVKVADALIVSLGLVLYDGRVHVVVTARKNRDCRCGRGRKKQAHPNRPRRSPTGLHRDVPVPTATHRRATTFAQQARHAPRPSLRAGKIFGICLSERSTSIIMALQRHLAAAGSGGTGPSI